MCFEAEEILGCQQAHLFLSFIPQGRVTYMLCPRHCAGHWASVGEQKNLSHVWLVIWSGQLHLYMGDPWPSCFERSWVCTNVSFPLQAL